MADSAVQGPAHRPIGIRLRTTLAAVLIVALALGLGAVALVLLVRDSLADGLQTSAETQAESLAAQITASGLPSSLGEDVSREDRDEDDPEEPDDELTQITDRRTGAVVLSTQSDYALPSQVVGESFDEVSLEPDEPDDAEHLVVSRSASFAGTDYVVTVALSREEIDDASAALTQPLALVLPALLLVVGATTWFVVGRALRPVRRIREEVEQITEQHLDRRVPEPGTRDEIGRLAVTMNAMLTRLQLSREQQQRFVSDASHELRSPIATLRQSAEVAGSYPDAFGSGEFVETVASESQRMQRLVEQLLLLARTEEGLRGPETDLDVDDLLTAEATRIARTGLQVDVSAVDHVRARLPRTAVAQIIRNLVDNAARHAESRVTLGLTRAGGSMRIVVADDGAGIPAADVERIFDRFVRLDESRTRDAGGSGLGLAIVRDLARSQGGDVWVESPDAGGARFVVSLPVGDSAP